MAFALLGLGIIVGMICANINDFDSNIVAVAFFEIDVFLDDGVVGIAQNEKPGLSLKACDLVGLAFFDEAGKLFTV